MLELNLGDIVLLRKKHPCGGDSWEVVRLGSDVGMVCQTCHHRTMLDRLVLERRIYKIIPSQSDGVDSVSST
ncbi:DUF951 domain-containing protein [Dehalococcoidia bacterium]|nr:DUF951 domain-containing protein [Dehalococcoidia bacterium]